MAVWCLGGLRRGASALLGMGVVAVLLSCGGDSSPTLTAFPTPTPTPIPKRVVAVQRSLSGFESGVWISIELLLVERGVLDITVDWTYPDTWMYVYFSRTNCDYHQLAGRTCPFILSSETKDPKPRVLYTEALDPGTYYLILYNVPRNRWTGIGSDNTESVSIQIGHTAPTGTGHEPILLGHPSVVCPL